MCVCDSANYMRLDFKSDCENDDDIVEMSMRRIFVKERTQKVEIN